MSVGVDRFDVQHKNILAMCYGMLATAETVSDRAALGASFEKLIAIVEDHLEQEDAFLNRIGYPGAEAHYAENRRLLDDLKWFRDQYTGAGPFALNPGALRFLGIWLTEHIKALDSRYRAFVEQTGPS